MRSEAPTDSRPRTVVPKAPCKRRTSIKVPPKATTRQRKPRAATLAWPEVGMLEARLGGILTRVEPIMAGPLVLREFRLATTATETTCETEEFTLAGPWRSARLRVPQALVDAALAPFASGLALPAAARALLMELALEEFLAPIEAALGPIEIAPVKRKRRTATSVALSCTAALAEVSEGGEHDLVVSGCERFQAVLADALASRAAPPSPHRLDDVVLPARVRLARVALAAATVRGLEAGDILFPGATAPDGLDALMGGAEGRIAISCAGHTIQARTKVTADRTAHAAVVAYGKEEPMSASEDRSEPSPISPDNIEVVLDVEFAREGLTLAQLNELQPGSVLVFAQSLDAPLTVRVNGRPFAECEAVRIGDKAGVRLVRILHSDQTDGPPATPARLDS